MYKYIKLSERIVLFFEKGHDNALARRFYFSVKSEDEDESFNSKEKSSTTDQKAPDCSVTDSSYETQCEEDFRQEGLCKQRRWTARFQMQVILDQSFVASNFKALKNYFSIGHIFGQQQLDS